MRKTVIIDDVTGEEIQPDEVIRITIEAQGMMFEAEPGCYTNALVIETKEANLARIKNKVKTVKETRRTPPKEIVDRLIGMKRQGELNVIPEQGKGAGKSA